MDDNKSYETKKTVEAEPVRASAPDTGRGHLRFDTMLVGILLIALGGFLLYTNYDPKFDFRELVLTWWPLAFVLVGVIKIIQSMMGVPSKGSGVGWLIFGAIIMMLLNGVHWSDWDEDFNIGFINSHHKAKEDSQVIELSGQTKLMLDLKRTDVAVYGYSGKDLKITEKVFVRGRDKDNLDAKAEKFQLGVDKKDDTITIVSNPLLNVKSVNTIYVELEIQVPENMEIEFTGERSDFYVKDFDGALTLRSDIGDITMDRVDGAVKIICTRGDINLNKLSGKMEINGKRLEIDIVDAYGELTIDTERSSVELIYHQPMENGVNINTSRASVELSIDSDSSFDFDAQTSSGRIYYEFDSVDDSFSKSYSRSENGGKNKLVVRNIGGSIHLEEI